MSDLFDSVIESSQAERPAYRQAPAGDYLVVVRDAKAIKSSQKGTPGIEMNFTMQEYFGTGDMEGVDLSRARLRDTLWITENSKEIAAQQIVRIAPEAAGASFRDALDMLPGAEVVVNVVHITEDRNGEALRTPRLEVKRYFTKDWYFENRLKAA